MTALATKMPKKVPAHHTFRYIFCRHHCDVKLYSVTFYGEVINKNKKKNSFSLSKFECHPWVNSPLRNSELIWLTMQVAIIATKFERAQTHITADVFAADTVVVAKNFWILSLIWHRHQGQYFTFISLSSTTNLNRDGLSLSILSSGLPIRRASNCLDCLDTWVVQKYSKFYC